MAQEVKYFSFHPMRKLLKEKYLFDVLVILDNPPSSILPQGTPQRPRECPGLRGIQDQDQDQDRDQDRDQDQDQDRDRDQDQVWHQRYFSNLCWHDGFHHHPGIRSLLGGKST